MIALIAMHMMIGLGGLLCGKCGQKICRHRAHIALATFLFLLIEATVSVMLIDTH